MRLADHILSVVPSALFEPSVTDFGMGDKAIGVFCAAMYFAALNLLFQSHTRTSSLSGDIVPRELIRIHSVKT
ncbi:MAG: hypothetical protein ACD_40C00123G0002 [uncultured bacterium]|nr:MAG: hypothetical protein ACD_40C00123G0002 [uncultured bacterium]